MHGGSGHEYRFRGQIFSGQRKGRNGGGEADPLQRCTAQGVQPGQREHQVRPAFGVDQGVEFVDDHGLRGTQHVLAGLGGEQQVEGLRRGDQDMGRPADHLLALPRGGVSGADRSLNERLRADTGQGAV